MRADPPKREDFEGDPRRAWLWRIAGGIVVIVLATALVWVARDWMSATTPAKNRVQQIAVLRQQPPPPPPKPPEKPPEPPRIKEEVKLDQPKPEPTPENKSAEPPPDRPLGLDADGSAGADGFGLAANKGGRDITTIGSTVGGSGVAGRYFTGLLQRNFFDALARNRKAPIEEFSVVVRVWLSETGSVARTQLVDGSGNPQLDELILATLAEMAPLREVPPSHLRQVQLRLNRKA